jgi:hypothetical protein
LPVKTSLIILLAFVPLISLTAQPEPGDLFREYAWFNEPGDCQGALRVGGKLDYRLIENVINYQGAGIIQPPFAVDLKQAIRAELVIEKMLCHEGTGGLRVSINGQKALYLPVSPDIPKPQSDYAHHYNVVVPVDLSLLKQGEGNTFLFEVDTAGHWWPQNLVYGMILRVYYKEELVQNRARITQPATGGQLSEINQIILGIPRSERPEKIDLVGYYEDADLEGDGRYIQWHYSYHKCQLYHHIGSISSSPFEFGWNTEWIPDQNDRIRLAAFVHRSDGLIYMTESVDDLELVRQEYAVELCKPYRRPKAWFTRNGEFQERFQVKGNLEQAAEAKMVFRTWSPGYFNGIYINDFLVLMKEGPKYAYYEHEVPVELHVLKKGDNILKTGLTPLYPEGMVHGVEVQWPGIMLLIRYKKPSAPLTN